MGYTVNYATQDAALAAELLQISRAISELSERMITKFYEEPEKLRDGMLVYADGTDWNPGSGEGAYLYYNAVWNFLG